MKKNKTRLLFFCIIHLIFMYFVIGYTTERCGVWLYLPYLKNELIIDGSNIQSILTNGFIFLTNGILDFIISGSYILITIVISCIIFLPFYFITKNNTSTTKEIKITKIVLLSWIIIYILLLIITGFKSLIFSILLMFMPVIFEYIYYKNLKQ